MIITLVLQSGDGSTRVEYKTDLTQDTLDAKGNFTVMEIIGLSDEEKHNGLDFQTIPHNVEDFQSFAEVHNLSLTAITPSGSIVIADYTDSSSSSKSLGDS